MKSRRIALLVIVLAASAIVFAVCKRGPKPGDQSTPTLAYKALYEAVKKKDSEAIKKVLSKGTLAFMENYAAMQKKTINQVIENGMTETTFAAKLPPSRNEKITGELAILEVRNEKTGVWDALPFAREDGKWKLAFDTFWKGTMSPNGPANPEHPGELPPGAVPGPPQASPPNQKSRLPEQGAVPPGMPGPVTPDAPHSAPTPGTKPGPMTTPKRDVKPPTR